MNNNSSGGKAIRGPLDVLILVFAFFAIPRGAGNLIFHPARFEQRQRFHPAWLA